ncbi:transcriptional regulator [Fusarium beomiforme]|uniref:Transcriptional regulator n=1 Tax=Fusarium beomiforme TaxID=44412 RepID=A0A9P5A643_9HYPO|nr:transcriptional regulator [Fusarium beomiforme]
MVSGNNHMALITQHNATSSEYVQFTRDQSGEGRLSDSAGLGEASVMAPQLQPWLPVTLGHSKSLPQNILNRSFTSPPPANNSSVEKRRTQTLLLLENAADMLNSEGENDRPACAEEPESLSLKEVTLASHLMLIFTEVIMGSQNTETHIQAAFRLLTDLDFINRLPQGFYSRFLVQRFAMIDMVLSFLRRRKPLAPMNFALYKPTNEGDNTDPSFRELKGCHQTVLSFLIRISVLASRPDIGKLSHVAEAYQLENEMRLWGSLRYPGPGISLRPGNDSSPDTRTEDIRKMQLDTLSECYYWVAHLLLARRVFLDPTTSHRVQLYRRHLFALMDRLPAGYGPASSVSFPFYMAAREAIDKDDKDWVRRKHSEMLCKYPEQSRKLMMDLTEEIWKKNDIDVTALGQDSWVDNDIYIGFLDLQASYFLF